MKIKEKLKKTRRRSLLSYLVAFLAVIYFLMTVFKGLYFWTDESSFSLALSIKSAMSWVMNMTWVFPISSLWQSIPAVPFEGRGILDLYKVIVPPVVIIGICALFISDHIALRARFYELKSELEKEINLREMRKEAGLETVAENATVDVVISNATNSDPAWHETWWGRVFIGVAIALIVAAFGIK
ncbi:hypothetical protein [Chromohalobacter sp. HP20-39]|uniref:hypothetical protein n=1 Tax=Chromohalobacter sp. HP20-39 TaxID=3079306 RepID=UPI00294B131F|nr:hypothetical protein [Chromohalobacter sp. HP20-39]MDV6318709.1 hypothetical protein [Chromohalobacter sp. HP20-39]